MHAYIELLDLQSGNVVTTFAHEHEAWAWLQRTALQLGLDELADLGLAQIRNGQTVSVIMEEDLVRRVADELNIADDRVREERASAERAAS